MDPTYFYPYSDRTYLSGWRVPGVEIVTPPTYPGNFFENSKWYSQISPSVEADDDQIQLLARAAYEALEKWLGRSIFPARRRWRFNFSMPARFALPEPCAAVHLYHHDGEEVPVDDLVNGREVYLADSVEGKRDENAFYIDADVGFRDGDGNAAVPAPVQLAAMKWAAAAYFVPTEVSGVVVSRVRAMPRDIFSVAAGYRIPRFGSVGGGY